MYILITFRNLERVSQQSLYAGDFWLETYDLYAISYDDNNLHTVNTTTGEFTWWALLPPAGKWSGLSGTPDGIFMADIGLWHIDQSCDC